MQTCFLLFNANIWGTVADWCMASITAITAFYLYRTLRSQQEVQRTQTKLFEIESVRFRESIKPKLIYKVSEMEFRNSKDEKDMLTIEVTNETDRIAMKIKSDYETNKQAKQVFIPMEFPRRHLSKGEKPLLFHFLIDPKPTAMNFINFALTYQDVAGTKYTQRIFCIKDSYGVEINPSLPEICN